MTHEGGYKPLNRAGIESSASPLLKMSFETTMHFLNQATLTAEPDALTSPSASIILGKPPRCGTGSFELHAHLNLSEEDEAAAEQPEPEVEETAPVAEAPAAKTPPPPRKSSRIAEKASR